MGKNAIGARETYTAETLSVGEDIGQYRRYRAARAGGPDPNPQPGSQPPVHEPPSFPDDDPPHDEPHEDPPPPVRHDRSPNRSMIPRRADGDLANGAH